MTKNELMEMLEGLPDDAEITVAVQRSWPFENQILNLCRKVNGDGDPVGLVIAAGDNFNYTTSDWWDSGEVEVDEDGDPVKDEDDEEEDE